MAYVVADAVYDYSTSTGTGTVTVLNTPPSGYRSFDAVTATNDLFPYRIRNFSANEFEEGIATKSATSQFTRTTVLSGSNGTSAVNFGPGTKEVILAIPAARSVYGDDVGRVVISSGLAPALYDSWLEIDVTGGRDALKLINYGNDGNFSTIVGAKTRNASPGGQTIVNNGDTVLAIRGYGDDGAGPKITGEIDFIVDGVPGTNDMPGRLVFYTTPDGTATPVERLRIDNAGHVIVGGSTTQALAAASTGGAIQTGIQVYSTTETSSVGIARYTNDGVPCNLILGKSRGASIGTNTVVQNGDAVGEIDFIATDGTNFRTAAVIQAFVDGNVTGGGAADMPGRLVFLTTPDGSATSVERMRIDNAGLLSIGKIIGQVTNSYLQVASDGSVNNLAFLNYGNNSTGPDIYAQKTRSAGFGTTIVQNGDVLFNLTVQGADGAAMQTAAQIQVHVDGTPGAGDMPGRIKFYTTPDGSATALERMNIPANGNIVMGDVNAPSGVTLSLFNNNGNGQLNCRFDGSGSGLLINQVASGGNVDINNQANAGIRFDTNNISQAMLDSSGRFIVSAGLVVQNIPVGGNINGLEAFGNTVEQGGFTLGEFNATAATCAHIDFYRSKSGTVGNATVVASGDALGSLTWYGAQQTGTFGTQNPAARIIAEVDGTVTSGAGADMPGRLRFLTTPDGSGTVTEAMRIDALQCVTIGGAVGNALTAFGANSQLEVNSDANVTASFLRWTTANAAGPDLVLGKSRSGTIGTHTIVNSGDSCGNINFVGSNGTTFDVCAQISGVIDATPGATTDMPGRLMFYTTPDASATPTERMRIANGGNIYVQGAGTTASTTPLAIINNASTPANELLRSTSSLRVKTNIDDVSLDRVMATLKFRVIEYNSLCPADDPDERFIGLGAEPVAEIDPVLVAWGRDRLPNMVAYNSVHLLRTEALKLRCAALEARIAELERTIR